MCIDRAGIVGNDGETHQGTFDLAYLSLIPNMVVMAPKCTQEMEVLLRFAVKYNGPIAIRYSRGGDEINLNPLKKVTLGKWETIDEGKDVAIIATGKMVQRVIKASEKYNLRVTIINATFIKPLDEDMLEKLIEEEYNIITIEDGILDGGMGSLIQVKLNELGFNKKIISMGFDDKFIQQGSPNELYDSEGLSYENIRDNVEKLKK
jgi:1-deoxy-D-xylulose-5-phosphate synthase